MCDCLSRSEILCMQYRHDIERSLAECLGGCPCSCHTALADEQEKKKEQRAKKLPVRVKFSEVEHMWKCPDCGMWLAIPESHYKHGEKAS